MGREKKAKTPNPERKGLEAPAGGKGHIYSKPIVHVLLIALLGALVYSNTFDVPFVYDDDVFIVDNPIVKDLGYFLSPSEASGFEQYGSLRNRYVGYLSFALNYRMNGLDAAGYHMVNLAVHILNALLVFWLVRLAFKTPFLSAGRGNMENMGGAAFLAALFFVSHPLQTEAVTYVFQRLASLAAFFYLLSLVAYIKSRLSAGRASGYAFYAASLLSAVLAMKTKENAFTLPVVMVVFEFMFFEGGIKKRAIRLSPMLLMLFIIPTALMDAERPLGEIMGNLSSATRGYEAFSRTEYLLTQFVVMVTYVRLLFLPVNQNFDYDYPVFESMLDPRVLLSLSFLLTAFGLSLYLLCRSLRGNTVLRLIPFGIFWFLITLSVESSVVPLPTIINEYRVYLPGVGVAMVVAAAAAFILKKRGGANLRRLVVASLVLVTVVCSFLTYQRNAIWRSEVSLWEDSVAKSPGKARPHAHLGGAYARAGEHEKSKGEFLAALGINPDYAYAHSNLGVLYEGERRYEDAAGEYRKALEIFPDFAVARFNLASVYGKFGMYQRAEEEYLAAVGIDPGYAEAHNNLGVLYFRTGRYEEALREFKEALRLKPGSGDFMGNLERAYKKMGDPSTSPGRSP
jgi:Tfp pilus assembly protein PilF